MVEAMGARPVEEAVALRQERTRCFFPRKRKPENVGIEHLREKTTLAGAEAGGAEGGGGERKKAAVVSSTARVSVKWAAEYRLAEKAQRQQQQQESEGLAGPAAAAPAGVDGPAQAQGASQGGSSLALALPQARPHTGAAGAEREREQRVRSSALAVAGSSTTKQQSHQYSASVIRRQASKWPKPEWHAPWKLYRVTSGHMGWVRSVAFDPANEWFCTGSADRTIKIWDLASGRLKLTLTGHIEQVTGLAVSPRHPYMFSCGLDKQVKCWDLEYNTVIRNYHGHLSGVYCMALHPTLDILFTGGRDASCRVWDMRTKAQIHVLTGHSHTVCTVQSQGSDPQVITGSYDSQVKLWDLVAAKAQTTLTHHKKGVRAIALHPREYAFASCSIDNIKKFKLPEGKFMHNMLQRQKTIVNAAAVNSEGVMATCADNGNMWLWDWHSGNKFQEIQSPVQPGSLDSESGIFAASFDVTGTRLVTCEADKTIKFYKEDLEATPESHPVHFKPPSAL